MKLTWLAFLMPRHGRKFGIVLYTAFDRVKSVQRATDVERIPKYFERNALTRVSTVHSGGKNALWDINFMIIYAMRRIWLPAADFALDKSRQKSDLPRRIPIYRIQNELFNRKSPHRK